MKELFKKVSNNDNAKNKGRNIMTKGDTTILSAREYKCSDGTCAGAETMLSIKNMYGTIRCMIDDASCVLNGESKRRGMWVLGTDSGTLTIRAIRFKNGKSGKSNGGGGVGIANVSAAKIDIILCVFDSCEATNQPPQNLKGGGGILVKGATVNIYATRFTGNSAPDGKGKDIRRTGGNVNLHNNVCPSPYSAITPTQGKYENHPHIIIDCCNRSWSF